MARRPTQTTDDLTIGSDAQELIDQMRSLGTPGDLYKFAISEGFKTTFSNLNSHEQTTVRDAYSERRSEVQNRKKLDEIDGQVVTVKKVRHGYSERFGNDFVVITADLEGEEFEVISSATIVVRHFNQPAVLNRLPGKYLFSKEQRKNGHTMWNVSALNPQANNTELPW